MKDIEFKKTLSLFSTGICIVSIRDGSDFFGLTVNSFSSLSMKPKQILFCIGNENTKIKLFKKNKNVGLNILSKKQKKLAIHFATHDPDKRWKDLSRNLSINNLPILKESLVHIDTKISKILTSGDHKIIICDVLNSNFIKQNFKPLIYFKSIIN